MTFMLALRLSAGRRRPHRWEWELTMPRSLTEVVAANPPARANACASSASIADAERPKFCFERSTELSAVDATALVSGILIIYCR
jgi:hypothetical protein